MSKEERPAPLTTSPRTAERRNMEPPKSQLTCDRLAWPRKTGLAQATTHDSALIKDRGLDHTELMLSNTPDPTQRKRPRPTAGPGRIYDAPEQFPRSSAIRPNANPYEGIMTARRAFFRPSGAPLCRQMMQQGPTTPAVLLPYRPYFARPHLPCRIFASTCIRVPCLRKL